MMLLGLIHQAAYTVDLSKKRVFSRVNKKE